MAYKVELDTECQAEGCVVRAMIEVFGQGNSYYGKFCRKHGNAKVKYLNELEIFEPRSEGRYDE